MNDSSLIRKLPVQVVADDREARCGVVEVFRSMSDVQVTTRRLRVGDYEIDGGCLFERKTVSDFAASVIDQRLFLQAKRLAAQPWPVALILEGKPSELANTGLSREALQGALISLSLLFQIPVLRSLDPGETARLMLYAAHQLRRSANGVVSRAGYRPKTKRKIQSRILQGLPCVGPERAEALLNVFGCVEAVMTADVDKLTTVPGIGGKTAAAIHWAAHEEPGPYQTANGC
jgi:DNA excision repair protein ERCC-4